MKYLVALIVVATFAADASAFCLGGRGRARREARRAARAGDHVFVARGRVARPRGGCASGACALPAK